VRGARGDQVLSKLVPRARAAGGEEGAGGETEGVGEDDGLEVEAAHRPRARGRGADASAARDSGQVLLLGASLATFEREAVALLGFRALPAPLQRAVLAPGAGTLAADVAPTVAGAEPGEAAEVAAAEARRDPRLWALDVGAFNAGQLAAIRAGADPRRIFTLIQGRLPRPPHGPCAPIDLSLPPPPSRTDWTRLVPPSVLTGLVSSLIRERCTARGAEARAQARQVRGRRGRSWDSSQRCCSPPRPAAPATPAAES
jgi:hypothetical protein